MKLYPLFSKLWFIFLIGAGNLSTSLFVNAQNAPEQPNQNDSTMLDELVVTAMRSELGPYQVPYNVYTRDETSLWESLDRTIPEALSQIPGVMVQKTANGHGSPYIRGFTGYRTIALIDGIRYSNATFRDGPNEYFGLLDSQSIAGLELLLGPSSVLYGSDAIGGALNLKTRKANYLEQEKDHFFQQGSQRYRYASAENSHTLRTDYQLGVGGKWGLQLGYSWKDFGDVKAAKLGTQPHTGYDEQAWDLRLDYNLSSLWTLTLAHQNLTQDDAWRTHSTIYAKSFAGTTIGSDQQRLKDQKRNLTYLRLAGDPETTLADSATFTLSHQFLEENGDRIRGNGRRQLEDFDSHMFGLDLRLEKELSWGNLTYGADYYRTLIDSSRIDYNANGTLRKTHIQGPIGDDSTYELLGAYLQADLPINERLDLIASTRLSHVSAKIGRYEDPVTGTPANYNKDWTNLSSSLRATYQLTQDESWLLWGGLAQSFRAPNVADLSRLGSSRTNEVEVPSTELDPEKFLTLELGTKTQADKLETTATYFYTFIEDYISNTPTGQVIAGENVVSKRNSSDGYVHGIELSGKYDLDLGWTIHGGLTWMEGELDAFPNVGAVASEREPLSRIMPLTAHLGLKWQSEDGKIWAGANYTYADKADKLSSRDKGDTQRIPPGGTPEYSLVTLFGGYRITENLTIHGAIENLLDEDYRVHGSGSNEPGIGLNLGIEITF